MANYMAKGAPSILTVEDQDIIKRYTIEDPKSLSFLSEKIGCSKQTISNYRQKLGIKWSLKCKGCGKDFETTNSTQKYCSRLCREKHRPELKPKIIKTCLECNNKFETSRPFQKYCSIKCRKIIGGKKRKEQEPLKILDKKCKNCGHDFQTIKSLQIFCSYICNRNYYLKMKHDSIKIIKIKCRTCGEIINKKSTRHNFCSLKCRLNYSLIKKQCPQCKKEFYTHYFNKRFCSKKCQLDSIKVVQRLKKCEICGEEFTPKKSTKRFCSPTCRGKYYNKIANEDRKNKSKILQKKICPHCNKQFETFNKKKKYCCDRCSQMFNERKRYTPKTQSMTAFLKEKYPIVLHEYLSSLW